MTAGENRVTVRSVKALDGRALAQLAELYRTAGFVEPDDDPAAWLPEILHGSLLAAAAFADGELIGFGRALGDGRSDAFLQDVAVVPAWRKRGVGRKVVAHLIAELRARGVDWIGLIAAPGKAEFYRRLGFAELPGHIPMRLQ